MSASTSTATTSQPIARLRRIRPSVSCTATAIAATSATIASRFAFPGSPWIRPPVSNSAREE
ncbi:hypothetical protein [Curtobacterium sp. MCJR17_043]|uniref:hypothetical protein n=1 Tax=Curtobacterium sp. MCJR17_043 TaxID=2175660 RepID=UPI0024E01293|nr:hypothetical protein [Curtobacterium sp. MCJR17_043]WIB35265.1 hypothetical protein DEJ15_13080 [Curtobacterium sp. MCJR17_043]